MRPEFAAYVAYAGMILAALFEVGHDGVVQIIAEEPLGRFISFQ